MALSFDSFVLTAATADLDEAPAARPHADAVEFRMDLADDDPTAAIAAYQGQLPLIVTNRPEWEGGGVPDGDGRFETLRRAVEHPAVAAVDLELRSIGAGDAAETVAHAREHGASVIASVHDFETTPPRAELGTLLDRATEHGDVGKLAVTAGDAGDVLALLDATWTATRDGRRVATMAMGEPGRHSRAVAPLYGSRIGYAPVDPASATAPGQYDLATLSDLLDGLRASGDTTSGPDPDTSR